MGMGSVIGKVHEFYLSKQLSWIILAVGFCLRLRQYFCNRSLWVDEAALAVNFVGRTFSKLLLPLKYGQTGRTGVFNDGKTGGYVVGASELVLRLFPLLAR